MNREQSPTRPRSAGRDRAGARIGFLTGLCLILTTGCSSSPPATSSDAAVVRGESVRTEVAADGRGNSGLDLERPLRAWREHGTPDGATQLRSTAWDDPRADFSSAVLRMSEAEFTALPAGDQSRIRDDALVLLKDVRGFAREIAAESRALRTAGRVADAEITLRSLASFGDRLSTPGRHLDLVRLVGEAVSKLAARELAGAA